MAGFLLVTVNSEAAEFSNNAYGRANAVAYEIFSSLKTLLSLNATDTMGQKFYKETKDAEENGIARAWKVGFANAALLDSFILLYGIITVFGGWMLVVQIREVGCDPSGNATPARNECNYFMLPEENTGSGILLATLCVAFGGQSMGQIATAIDAFAQARKSAKAGFDVIQRIPTIDILSEEGWKPSGKAAGEITLKDVHFQYPARPDIDVCVNYSLAIPAGTTMALVGESGSGKSTIMNLVQRFYDPASGNVMIDGMDIREWNLRKLRSNISLVGQEPKLFTGTIADNIANGVASDPELAAKTTRADIENAAKMANAHKFIMKFPLGYDTDVGHGGSQMSGGQKQRIAIARALLKNPSILLLSYYS